MEQTEKPRITLDARSEKNLLGVHPDLDKVVRVATTLSKIVFVVIEGLRSIQRQAQLVRVGASKTMDSRHLTGHAVDLAASVNGQIRWDWPLYTTISEAMKLSAEQQKIPLTWGGDWPHMRDGPHFELPREFYK